MLMDCRRFIASVIFLLMSPASLMAAGFNPGDAPILTKYQVSGSTGGIINSQDLHTCIATSDSDFTQCAQQAFANAYARKGIPSECTPSQSGIAWASLGTVNSVTGRITTTFQATTWDSATQSCVPLGWTASGDWYSSWNRLCPQDGKAYVMDSAAGKCRALYDLARGNPTTCPIKETRTLGGNSKTLDPVDITSGAVIHQEEDVSFAGGLLSFSRYYNSNESFYNSSGNPTLNYSLGNWRGDFLPSVTGSTGGSITIIFSGINATATVTRPDGRSIIYSSEFDSATQQFTKPWVSTSADTNWQLTSVAGASAWASLELSIDSGRFETYAKVTSSATAAEARLASIRDGDGTLLTITRTGAKVTRVTDRFLNALDFVYGSAGGQTVVTKIKVNSADWATYSYNTKGYLSKVEYKDGNCRLYFYDDMDFPIGLSRIETKVCTSAASLPVASWNYDVQGRADSNAQGDVQSGNLAYLGQTPGGYYYTWKMVVTNTNHMEFKPFLTSPPEGTERAVETFPNGLENRYAMVTRGGRDLTTRKTRILNGVETEYLTSYDNLGNVTRTQDWNGNVTSYLYDSRNLETSRTEAEGEPEQRTITTEWHATLRKPVRITTPTLETVYTYVGGKPETRTETDLTSWASGSRTWVYAYTAQGLLQSVDGPLAGTADTTTYAYNAAGFMTSVTNALGQMTQITQHNALGYPKTVIDPNGITTQLGYDGRGNLSSTTRVDPVIGNLTTSFTRDPYGNIATVTLPDGSVTVYTHNAAGKVMSITDATGATIEYERDAEGNAIRTHVRHASGALVRRLEQIYDGLQQVTAVTGISTTHATYEYDQNGNATETANGLGHATVTEYDALERLITSTDALGAVTEYDYDAADNLTTVTDARNLTTHYEYDGFGCLRRQTSPDTGVTTYTCDKAGNVTSKTDARGVTATYGYDLLNRLNSTVYSTAPGEMALYGYDATANGNKGIGRLTAVQNDGADIARKYDARGNLVEERRTIKGLLFVTGYTYDTADRLTAITYPSGRVVNYIRNGAGLVTSVTTSAASTGTGTVASNILWAPFGGHESLTYGNGLIETRNYDTDGFLTHIGIGSLISRSYVRDAAGRIDDIVDPVPAQSEGYAYDNTDRLTQATGPFATRNYFYDAVGNRTSLQAGTSLSSYTYDSTSNRLLDVTGANAMAMTYDAVGNTLTRGAMTFTYNAANRLKTVNWQGTTYTMTYSALGERTSKAGAGWTAIYHYDAEGHLIAESNPSGFLVREYIWLGDKPLAQVAVPNNGTQHALYFVHTDHLDDAMTLTDAAQQVVWDYNRDPYGANLAGSNTVKWMLRFPGQYFESETGLHYNYFRDYDPQTGRYIESDPIGLDGGVNTYAYANGNPVSNVDPTGEIAIVIPALPAIGAALAEAGAALAGGAALASLALIPGDSDKSKERAITQPPKPNRGVTCTCRAAANGQQSGNCPDQEYAFGTATAPTYREARAEAERIARKNLGKQAKHTQCKCTDSKGNPVY